MTPEQWQVIKDKIEPLLEVEASQRSAYVDRIAGDDRDLRRELESLLAANDKMDDDFLNIPVYSDQDAVFSRASMVGRKLGPYQIVAEIGRGGMGEVYRALRVDDQYRKQVAIKLIREGRESEFIVARFKHERQVLANLEHPNIARLLDGGTTAEGVPYLVMELIEGESIVRYSDRRLFDVRSRLELFLQVCSAVQFAHQRLIIHRDIKPGNILVTPEGVPKLLDFGISKILGDENDTVPGERTITGLRMLTPAYASPEQVKGETITTASDVYSLGMVLYELLVGRLPYPTDSGERYIVRAICEEEPARPSTAARTNSENRNSEPTASSSDDPAVHKSALKLSKLLRGDLDNIVLMALRKEPQQRYVSVEQFSEDIRRYLRHLPVIARKDTARYRASKFVLRHKAGVVAAAIVFLSILTSFVFVIREERIAQRRFNDVRSLANSLMFDVHDSIKDLPGSTPARKLIVQRALQFLNSLAGESRGDLGLQRDLATAYERVGLVQGHYLQSNLGDVKGSIDSYEKALNLRNAIDRSSKDWNDKLALARCFRLIADLQSVTGSIREGRDHINRAIAITEALNKEHPNTFGVLHELSLDYQISHDIRYADDVHEQAKQEADFQKNLAANEAALRLKPDDLDALYAHFRNIRRLGSRLEDTNPKAALEYYQQGLQIEQALTKRSNAVIYARALALAYRDISAVYANLGDTSQVLENEAKSLSILEDINRADPQNETIRQSLAIEYVNTALPMSQIGKTEAALENWKKSLEMIRSLVDAAPENRLHSHYLAGIVAAGGTIQMRSHKPLAAVKEFEEARSIYQSLRETFMGTPFDIAGVAECTVKLGEALASIGESEKAAQDFQQALALTAPITSSDPPDLNGLYAKADAFSGLGDLSLNKASDRRTNGIERRADWEMARSWYMQSLATWGRIQHPNRSTPGNSLDAGDPAIVAKKLQRCEARFGNDACELKGLRRIAVTRASRALTNLGSGYSTFPYFHRARPSAIHRASVRSAYSWYHQILTRSSGLRNSLLLGPT